MIAVGTSGWVYKHWRGPFYPSELSSKEWLPFYAEHFSSVEINNSFYHLPAPETFKQWRQATPPGFLFAVKGSRYITHMKKLKDPAPALEKFFEHASALREKLGPLLFQLPPHWKINTGRLEAFLKALPRRRKYAFEFRDPSWFDPAVYALLEKYRCAFCIYEIAGQLSPRQLTADYAYVRLHGPSPNKYQGDYPEETLRDWADWVERQASKGRSVYFYFDNDQNGYAAQNALALAQMTQQMV